MAKTCVCAAKLRPSPQLFKGTSPKENCFSVQMDMIILLCSSAHMASVFLLLRQPRVAPGSGLGTGLGTKTDKGRANMLITVRRCRRLRRGIVPQAQAAQKRLKYVSAPPSYRQVSNSSKVHRREGQHASVQMKQDLFAPLFCSSAKSSSSPAARAPCRRR
jgi:hypothetical protein